MKMSADGRKRLIAREGKKLRAYKDSAGVWTIGVGHTTAAGAPTVIAGLTITDAECDQILARDLVQYEDAVNRAVTAKLNQNQFDALCSFCFNIGTGGFTRSTVVKCLNAGDAVGAADALLMWNKPPEIMGRRRSERAQFLEAAPIMQPAPVSAEPSKPEPPAAPVLPPPPDIPKPSPAPTPESKGWFANLLETLRTQKK